MRKSFFIIFILSFFSFAAQQKPLLKAGEKAPGFVLQLQNSVQSFGMPYLNRIILLHFWSTEIPASKTKNRAMNRLAARYKNAIYKNADGFELIAIAVQNDKKAWNDTITKDSLTQFINSVAPKGFNDEICKKYGISNLPTDILIDENGIIIAVNPKLSLVEELLDERKNFLPVKKDVTGTIAYSSNHEEMLKQGKLYLFDAYYDSLGTTFSNAKGDFTFYDIKLNQDFIIKMDNQIDIITSDPLALFSDRGEFIAEGKTLNKGFVFYVPSNVAYKLTDENGEESLNGPVNQVNVVRNLIFVNNGAALTPKDEQDLRSILLMLQKNADVNLTITTHSDSKPDDKSAMELTTKQAKTIKDYLVKKGIAASRITTFPKGKTQPRRICHAASDCSDADHKQNRRVEFVASKN